MNKVVVPSITTAVGVLAGVAIFFFWPVEYISRATLQVVLPQISERFVPGLKPLDATAFLNRYQPTILSASAITTIIHTLDLFPSVRRRSLMSDAVDRFREQVRIQALSSGLIEISFSYEDPSKAKAAAAEIATRIIDESIRIASSSHRATFELIADEATVAKSTFEQLALVVRFRHLNDDGTLLSLELARKKFIDLQTKLSEISLLDKAGSRQLAAHLELLDNASISQPSESRPYTVIGIGALAGFIVGSLILATRRFLRYSPLNQPALA